MVHLKNVRYQEVYEMKSGRSSNTLDVETKLGNARPMTTAMCARVSSCILRWEKTSEKTANYDELRHQLPAACCFDSFPMETFCLYLYNRVVHISSV